MILSCEDSIYSHGITLQQYRLVTIRLVSIVHKIDSVGNGCISSSPPLEYDHHLIPVLKFTEHQISSLK
jgi:hypothetical protein